MGDDEDRDGAGGTPVPPPEPAPYEPPGHPLTAYDAWPLIQKVIA